MWEIVTTNVTRKGIYILGTMRQLTQCGDLQDNQSHADCIMWTLVLTALKGASFLSLRALKTPKRVVGWDSFSDHRAGASRSSRHAFLAGLCLWVFTSYLCPYKSKINISKITFSTCLSLFNETVKDCH